MWRFIALFATLVSCASERPPNTPRVATTEPPKPSLIGAWKCVEVILNDAKQDVACQYRFTADGRARHEFRNSSGQSIADYTKYSVNGDVLHVVTAIGTEADARLVWLGPERVRIDEDKMKSRVTLGRIAANELWPYVASDKE